MTRYSLHRPHVRLLPVVLAAGLLALSACSSGSATRAAPPTTAAAANMPPSPVPPSTAPGTAPPPSGAGPTAPPGSPAARPTTGGGTAGLDSVDWKNRAYDIPCPGPQPTHVVFKDGTADAVAQFHYDLQEPVYGTVGGQPVVAITQLCAGADMLPSMVELYKAGPNGPISLGYAVTLTDSLKGSTVSIANDTLAIAGLASSPAAGACCPDLKVTKKFTLTDDRIVPVQTAAVSNSGQ